MDHIDIQDSDFLQVAKTRASEDAMFSLQVKCIALIRMLEEANLRYIELEAKHEILDNLATEG